VEGMGTTTHDCKPAVSGPLICENELTHHHPGIHLSVDVLVAFQKSTLSVTLGRTTVEVLAVGALVSDRDVRHLRYIH
jgi:hypothetical protein